MSQEPKNPFSPAAPSRIKAVIFDMDGVLTDSEPLICAAAVAMFAEKGLRVQPEDFRPFVGTGEERYIGGVAERYHFKLDLSLAKRRIYEIYLEMVPTRLEAFPGVQDVVKMCRGAGLHLALASSADDIKIAANLRKIHLPPDGWDAIVSGELVKAKKPAPDLFLAAAGRLGVQPEECVVVEDAINGVVAAKAAGMRCIGVAQTFTAAELGGADLVRQKIAEVTLADLLGTGLGKGTALESAQGTGPYPRPALE
jgi:beta-phosphoglucomutase